MYGLSVRWSLADADPGVDAAALVTTLREYVVEESLPRFTGMDGLRMKTWRMRPGEWFEGTYVFETADARDAFAASMVQAAPTSKVTAIIGSGPVFIEPHEVVAVAEGGSGFATGGGPGE